MMPLTAVDWAVIAAYLLVSVAVGVAFTRRAGRSLEEFFLTGRSLPWWALGVSMVATTFAADTPLAVTGLVARHGIAGNWLWWNFALGGMLTAVFYAHLWRRAGVTTDVELAELRYAGRPAAFLRAFRALYLGGPVNCIIMGWVTLGMAKVLGVALGVGLWEAIGLCLAVTALYATMAGLWGVVVADVFQFGVSMTGAVVLAAYGVEAVGGLAGLREGLAAPAQGSGAALSLLPAAGAAAWMPVTAFAVYLGVLWWAAWYPGAEPGGGGYIAQRILAARGEGEAVGATLVFNLLHYAVRPWPWVLVALVALLRYPGLADPESGYVRVMVEVLPPAWRGLLLAAFAAAYMSTISTHLNWGASYLVHDVYRRFLVRRAGARHYVWVGRAATLLLLAAAALTTAVLESVAGAWRLLLALGAGTGAVYLLRWYWWRVNAWSEVAAMVGSGAGYLLVRAWSGWDPDLPAEYARLMVATVGVSTAAWLVVTWMTAPVPMATLARFVGQVRPAALGWRPVYRHLARGAEAPLPDRMGIRAWLIWALGCGAIYGALFGFGELLLGSPARGVVLLAAAAGCGVVVVRWLLAAGR